MSAVEYFSPELLLGGFGGRVCEEDAACLSSLYYSVHKHDDIGILLPFVFFHHVELPVLPDQSCIVSRPLYILALVQLYQMFELFCDIFDGKCF